MPVFFSMKQDTIVLIYYSEFSRETKTLPARREYIFLSIRKTAVTVNVTGTQKNKMSVGQSRMFFTRYLIQQLEHPHKQLTLEVEAITAICAPRIYIGNLNPKSSD